MPANAATTRIASPDYELATETAMMTKTVRWVTAVVAAASFGLTWTLMRYLSNKELSWQGLVAGMVTFAIFWLAAGALKGRRS
jgi:uncharacterized BrkB/YihY/UPF0761 family membrane protein